MALRSHPSLPRSPLSLPDLTRSRRPPPTLVSFANLYPGSRKLPVLRIRALNQSSARFNFPLSRPIPPNSITSSPHLRTLTRALREGSRRSTAAGKNPSRRSATAKKVVIFALVLIAVGSCVILVALGYVPQPEGMQLMEYARGAKDWIVNKVTLDERSRWILRDKAETAFDTFKTISGTVMLAWVQLIPLIWLHYQHQRSGFGDPAKKRRPVIQKVCFDDVEGVGAAKEELQEIVSCLQGSTSYDKLGAEPPRGTLLVGPPGTGKTLLARAVAGEAGVPFFSASASEFVEVFVGRGAARVRELFKEARKHQPSIVFIDELDAVGGKRGRSFNDEHDQTLVQLLTEMDGFETDSKVIVIAATNRPETLDAALCRPGRFSRKVLVGKPDLNGRKKILAVHMRDVPLEDDVQETCDVVAGMTPGLVGADLENIVKEAVLLAARRGADAVSREDILKSVERTKFGIENPQGEEMREDGEVDGKRVQRAVSGLYC